MNNPYFDLLMWARGPGFDIALVIMLGGIILRVVEIVVLGRKKDFATPKGSPVGQGIKTIFTRSVPRKGMMKEAPVTYIGGYLFHIGFAIAFLFLGAHISLIDELIGIQWPAANKALIETAVAVAVVALIALAWTRFTDPVRRALTTFDDWLVWALSILPLITGYVAVNRIFGDGTLMMALHILSAELLMVAFPFTKLMHAVTFAMARYYNGSIQGRKGAES
jgi:nitrate reductase gamma subunit